MRLTGFNEFASLQSDRLTTTKAKINKGWRTKKQRSIVKVCTGKALTISAERLTVT